MCSLSAVDAAEFVCMCVLCVCVCVCVLFDLSMPIKVFVSFTSVRKNVCALLACVFTK